MAHGTVGWIQVDTDDPESAKRFYGELFDWTFATDPNAGGKYHLISGAGTEQPHGGILDTGGESPSQATFAVEVSDVAAAVAAAERHGGKVVTPPTTLPTGLVTADLLDPAGNPVGVFTPPAR
jgi:predicted enzyme related to lactoylglutathione lyase